jgi:hypothetical protein
MRFIDLFQVFPLSPVPHNLKVIGPILSPQPNSGWSFSLIESCPSGRLSRFCLRDTTKLATGSGIAISSFSASH